jgi:hypothetical protein
VQRPAGCRHGTKLLQIIAAMGEFQSLPGPYFGLQRRRPSPLSDGFILPLTLWIVALIGLAIAAVDAWVATAMENSRILQHRAEAELALTNVENELVYAMAVRPLTYRGLEVGTGLTRPDRSDFNAMMAANYTTSQAIAFDDRPYVLESTPDFSVQIQDERGLVNLNTVTPPYLHRLLSMFNVPEAMWDRLADTLGDWIDEDNETRPDGAERDDYLRRGRLPPANAFMMSPLEAQSILDWDTIPQVWDADRKSPLFSTCPTSGFNPNTAPGPVLMTYIAGLTPDNEAEVIRHRKDQPFRNAYDFSATANVVTPNESFFFSMIPSPCVIVDLTDRNTHERTRFSLTLLPLGRYQPWQIDYVYKIPSQYGEAVDQANPTVTFPSPETLYLRESGDKSGAAGLN